jgi:hypothetical protein
MIRSITAIAIGFFYIAALSVGTGAVMTSLLPDEYGAAGVPGSPALLILTMAYVAAFAISGCYLAARLAPSWPMRHALILGALGLLVNIAGAVATWQAAPAWYPIGSVLLVMPYAWLGGRLRELELARGTVLTAGRASA